MRGFTLIELLVVFAIIAVLAIVGIGPLGSYNNTQVFKSSVSDVSTMLNTAKSRSVSQVKPDICGVSQLAGYRVKFTVTGQNYGLYAVCGTDKQIGDIKKLPAQLSFLSGSADNILFNVGTGIVNIPGSITVTGYGKSQVIVVNGLGAISIQ